MATIEERLTILESDSVILKEKLVKLDASLISLGNEVMSGAITTKKLVDSLKEAEERLSHIKEIYNRDMGFIARKLQMPQRRMP